MWIEVATLGIIPLFLLLILLYQVGVFTEPLVFYVMIWLCWFVIAIHLTWIFVMGLVYWYRWVKMHYGKRDKYNEKDKKQASDSDDT